MIFFRGGSHIMLQLSFSNVYSQYIQSETFQCPSQQIWGDQINENMRMSLTQVRTVGLDQVSYCNMKCIKHYKFWQKMYIKNQKFGRRNFSEIGGRKFCTLGQTKVQWQTKVLYPWQTKVQYFQQTKIQYLWQTKVHQPFFDHLPTSG